MDAKLDGKMGKGRPPLSDEIKKQRQTYQRCRSKTPNLLNSGTDRIVTLPDPPEYFKDETKQIYRAVGEQLIHSSFVIGADIPLIIQYCYLFAEWAELAADIEKNGRDEIRIDREGNQRTITREAVKQRRSTRAELAEIERKIGLDIMARNKMLSAMMTATKKKDEFLAY